MTITAFMAQLRDANIELFVENGRLRYKAPVGAFDEPRRAFVQAHRDELLDYLSREARCPCLESSWVDAAPENGRIRTTCRDCGRFIGYRPAEK